MRPREWASSVIGVVAIASAILLVGGALRWTQAIVAILVALALALQVASRRGFARRPLLLLLLGAAAGITLFQLVPMPDLLLERLQPVGNALREDGIALAGTSPWRALTLDAPGTLRALTTLVTLIGVAWVALRISATEGGRYRVLAAVAALCGLTALIVAVHELFGAQSLYGLYKPEQAKPSVMGPLLNENHLGGLMALGSMVAGGLALYRRQRSWKRVAWLLVVVGCGVIAVASESRGATLALIAGTVIGGGTLAAQRLFSPNGEQWARPSMLSTSLPIAIVAVCTIVVIVYASASGVSHQLARTSFSEVSRPGSKFAIWKSSAQLLEEAPWFGVGRGAFEPMISRIHPAAAVASFSHVENEYMQAVVDWGVPGAILVIVAVVGIVLAAIRRWRDGPLVAGAIGALSVVVLQSMFDFGIELLGLAVPATAVLATITYGPMRELEGRALLRARASRVGLVVALLAAAGFLISSATTSIAEDQASLSTTDGLQLTDVMGSLDRHPLDYYGYAAAAKILARKEDPRAVLFLNHALRLHPTHPGLHHMAARMLYGMGRRDQAAIEYAAALRAVVDMKPLLEEVLARYSPVDAARAIPSEVANLRVVLAVLNEAPTPDVAVAWLERVIEHGSSNMLACESLYTIALGKEHLAAAEAASKQCGGLEPGHDERVKLARVLLNRGRYDAALRTISDFEIWPRLDDRLEGWLVACDIHAARLLWDEAKSCVRRLDVSGIVPVEKRALVTTRLEAADQALRKPAP